MGDIVPASDLPDNIVPTHDLPDELQPAASQFSDKELYGSYLEPAAATWLLARLPNP